MGAVCGQWVKAGLLRKGRSLSLGSTLWNKGLAVPTEQTMGLDGMREQRPANVWSRLGGSVMGGRGEACHDNV